MKTYSQLVKGRPSQCRRLDRRKTAQRGYGGKWQAARKEFLAHHALCVHCLTAGKVTAASEVDHVVPHRGDMNMFWDKANWQALCKRCHSRKTRGGL